MLSAQRIVRDIAEANVMYQPNCEQPVMSALAYGAEVRYGVGTRARRRRRSGAATVSESIAAAAWYSLRQPRAMQGGVLLVRGHCIPCAHVPVPDAVQRLGPQRIGGARRIGQRKLLPRTEFDEDAGLADPVPDIEMTLTWW